MSSTTAREPRNDRKRTDEAILETDAQFIQGLKIFSGDSDSVSGLAGGNAQNSPQAPAGNYLAREGDSMIGPIAFSPPVNFRVVIAADDSINISNLGDSPQYSSNIELDSVQPNSLVLTRIDGANFDGQLLIMRTFGPDSFTLSQMTVGNGGNIQTPEDEDFIFEALQMVILVYDDALLNQAATGGTWRLLTSAGTAGGGGTGTYTSAKMDQDQIANLALNDHLQFNDLVEDGGIVLQGQTPTFDQTSGIFELKAGKTYYLYGDATVEFNANPDTAKIAWWDRTNGVQLGQKGSSFPFTNATKVSTKHSAQTIFTPATDVDVDLRIVNLSGGILTIFADDTQANIFEFSGQAGAPGADGSTAWKTPARAKTLIDVPNLAAFDVITDGVTLIQNDRVLLTEQITLSENGLWEVGVVAAGLAPLTRPTDFDSNAEVIAETFVAIEEGTTAKDTLWHLISNNPLTIDVSDQVWNVFAPGISGGPDLGGDEGGIDAAGEWVYDGRTATAIHITKRWEQGTPSPAADNGVRDVIYMPSNGNLSGRVFAMGDSNLTTPSAYSDDLGDSWTTSSLSGNFNWVRSAYDPVQNILVIVNTNGVNINSKKNYSNNRATSFLNIASPNTDNHNDVIWSPVDGLFVATCFSTPIGPGQLRGIQTSPDGINWTARVTPAPTSGFWKFVAYSTVLGLYVCTTGGGTDVMTSPDAITWTLHVTIITNGTEIGTHNRLINSEGQNKFVAVGSRRLSGGKEVTSWTSTDGINWEEFNIETFVDGTSTMGDVVWAPDLSLYVGDGGSTATGFNSSVHYWVSTDGENWTRISVDVTGFNSSTYQGITYAQEYGQFIAVTGTSNITIYRTFR